MFLLKGNFLSYRDSVVGFNGTDNVLYEEADEVLLDDLEVKEIAITEESMKLREIYPYVDITHEELVEYCQPWKKALVLTLLGRSIYIPQNAEDEGPTSMGYPELRVNRCGKTTTS